MAKQVSQASRENCEESNSDGLVPSETMPNPPIDQDESFLTTFTSARWQEGIVLGVRPSSSLLRLALSQPTLVRSNLQFPTVPVASQCSPVSPQRQFPTIVSQLRSPITSTVQRSSSVSPQRPSSLALRYSPTTLTTPQRSFSISPQRRSPSTQSPEIRFSPSGTTILRSMLSSKSGTSNEATPPDNSLTGGPVSSSQSSTTPPVVSSTTLQISPASSTEKINFRQFPFSDILPPPISPISTPCKLLRNKLTISNQTLQKTFKNVTATAKIQNKFSIEKAKLEKGQSSQSDQRSSVEQTEKLAEVFPVTVLRSPEEPPQFIENMPSFLPSWAVETGASETTERVINEFNRQLFQFQDRNFAEPTCTTGSDDKCKTTDADEPPAEQAGIASDDSEHKEERSKVDLVEKTKKSGSGESKKETEFKLDPAKKTEKTSDRSEFKEATDVDPAKKSKKSSDSCEPKEETSKVKVESPEKTRATIESDERKKETEVRVAPAEKSSTASEDKSDEEILVSTRITRSAQKKKLLKK